MKVRFYIIFLGLLFALFCEAQENKAKDSLEHILTLNVTDSVKARASFLLSDEWDNTDTIKATYFLEQGRKFSGKNKYLLALYNFYSGQLFFDTDISLAEKYYLKTDSLLEAFSTPEAYLFRARAWHNYGSCRQRVDDEKTMLTVLTNKAIPFALKSGDKEYLARNYADIGLIFRNRWQYYKAATYYEKAITLLRPTAQSKPYVIFIYIDAATNLLFMDSLVAAKKLIDITKPMLMVNTEPELDFYSNEGIYFRKTKQYANSLNSLNKALTAANKQKNAYLVESVLFLKYKTLTAMGNYEQAKNVLLRIISTKTIKYDLNRLMHYYELAETYARLGNMKEAYRWEKEYSTLRDSTNEKQVDKEINALEIKYQSVEKEKEIITLKAKNEQANLSATNNRLINGLLGSVSLFLLVVVVLGYFFYKNSKKATAQKEQIHVAQAMLQGQEEERKRVARDLHDGLGGMLASVKMNLSGFAQEKEKSKGMELYTIISQLDNSVKELRRIAHNMMPEMLLKLGLGASLKDLCESHISETLKIDFQYLGVSENIPVQEQITIYRIIQELLTNVVKHADAKKVLLQCSQNENIFFITIEDDGTGFDTTKLSEKQGMGMGNIKSRIAYLNGKMEVLSKQNQGTSINVEVNVTT